MAIIRKLLSGYEMYKIESIEFFSFRISDGFNFTMYRGSECLSRMERVMNRMGFLATAMRKVH
jgi:hypothetical protein